MKRVKGIIKYLLHWAKLAFTWGILNIPMILMTHFACWTVGYNDLACTVAKVLCFFWGVYTFITVIKYGDDVL